MTFLEFFEILLQCAKERYKEKEVEQQLQQLPVPMVLITNDTEASNETHEVPNTKLKSFSITVMQSIFAAGNQQ